MGFLRDMAGSTNPAARLNGLTAMLQHSIAPNELVATARRLADEAYEQRMLIFTGRVHAPIPVLLSNLVERVFPWGVPAPETLNAIIEDWQQRYKASCPDLSYVVWSNLINSLSIPGPKSIRFRNPSVAPRPAQINQLIERLEAIGRVQGDFYVRSHISRLLTSAGRTIAEPRHYPKNTNASTEYTRIPIAKVFSASTTKLPEGRTTSDWSFARRMAWRPGQLLFELLTVDDRNASPRSAIVRLNTKTIEGECLELPFIHQELLDAPSPQLAVGDDTYVVDQSALWRKSGRQSWREIPLPTTSGAIPYWWNNRLVLSAEHSILEVIPETDEVRILASSRRNPPRNALDREGNLAFVPLAVWPGERLCAQVAGQIWVYEPAQQDWNFLFAATNCGERLELQSAGVVYRQSGECGPRALGGWRPGSSKLNLFTVERPFVVPVGRLPYLEFTPAAWKVPDGFHPHDQVVAYDGSDVWAIAVDIPWRRRIAVEPSAALIVKFDHRFKEPLVFRPEFIGQAADFFGTNRSAPEQLSGTMEFLITPEGCAFLIGKNGTVIWIARQELEQAVQQELAVHSQSERPEFAALLQFDRNHNGWLDDDERQAMQVDQALQNERTKAEAESIRRAITEHQAEWMAVFTNIDRRHDGKLSGRDLQSGTYTYPAIFKPIFSDVYVDLAAAILPYDLDNDQSLDLDEFCALMASPRSLAEVNLSPDWVVKFGLKVEDCDKNSDGQLDFEERRLVSERIDARFGRAGARKN
jgi:hypothetical protein